jgi:hypothetical protein
MLILAFCSAMVREPFVRTQLFLHGVGFTIARPISAQLVLHTLSTVLAVLPRDGELNELTGQETKGHVGVIVAMITLILSHLYPYLASPYLTSHPHLNPVGRGPGRAQSSVQYSTVKRRREEA